ncbi:unnamed protein product [Calicophoron daubneyi]|uniref:G-protein coupled receptors family 1 profile domain-containing protein n=1 Tax=Calicophoron daubneyi TaxID=300641 RepID=A0AAV2TFV2_CALDB
MKRGSGGMFIKLEIIPRYSRVLIAFICLIHTTTATFDTSTSLAALSKEQNESSPASCVSTNAETMNFVTIFMSKVTPILFSLFFLLGFVGNLFVIIVILANAQMRNTTNILIFSLALADMAFIVVCVPSAATVYVTGRWPLGLTLCRIYYYFSHVSVYCSVYNLVLMSLDRFLAVVYPVECVNIRTQKNSVRVVLCLWIIVLASNIHLPLGALIVSGSPEGGDSACFTEYCTYSWLVTVSNETHMAVDNYEGGKKFFLIFFLLGYLFPFIVICGLYISLIARLRCKRTPNLKPSAEAKRSKRRVTHMVVTVVVIFGISWLPIHIVFLFQYYVGDPNTELFRVIQILSTCLAYGNSSINPVLYAFLSVNFRRSFIALLRGNRKMPGRIIDGKSTRPVTKIPEQTVELV